MPYTADYAVDAPDRAGLDTLSGPLLLEFGVDWCPHCQGAQAAIKAVRLAHPGLRHVKVEAGPGRRLGRSFRVKLWPTLVLLRDGGEIARLVRPTAESDVATLVARLAAD